MGKTSAGGKKIATKGSGHEVKAPPETSLCPPTPPAGPVPKPFGLGAKSSTASGTKDKLTVGGNPVLVKGSHMPVESPGNQESQPTGGDVMTHAVNGKVVVKEGDSNTEVGGAATAATGHSCGVNTMTPQQTQAQADGPLMKGPGKGKGKGSAKAGANAAAPGGTAVPATRATKKRAGTATPPSGQPGVGHPVDVATGYVVDTAADLTLQGAIPFELRRSYSSERHEERGLLGRGGWVLSVEQWVVPTVGQSKVGKDQPVLAVRLEDGREAYFEPIGPGERDFNRRERLELSAEAGPSGTIRYRVHDLKTRLWKLYDARSRTGPARIAKIADAFGNAITFAYDADRLNRVTDTANREIRFLYDPGAEKKFVTRVEIWAARPRTPDEIARRAPADPPSLQLWVDYAYGGDDCLAAATNALGQADRYRYDLARRMAAVTLRNGQSFYYEYEEDFGRCVKTWGDGGLHAATLTRQGDNEVFAFGTAEPRHFAYTDDGYVTLEENTSKTFVRKRTYDADRYVLTEANGAGEKASFTFDARGTRTSATDPAGNKSRWEYDEHGFLARFQHPQGHETRYEHDGAGALRKVVYPTGESYSLSYDGAGRPTAIYGPSGLSFGFSYDEHHNLIEETTSRGGRTQYRYDALGRPVVRTDAFERTTAVQYDRLGQPVAITYPDGTATHATCDALGNVASFTDALGHTTHLTWGGTGTLRELVEPTGQKWTFEYDQDERLELITNPRTEEYRYRYDDAGRVTEEHTFDQRILNYEYDVAGRLARLERPDSTWRSFLYDKLGNVVVESSPHGGMVFQRDKLGRLLEAAVDEPKGKKVTTAFERDKLGQVVAEVQNGRRIDYKLDPRGRVLERALPEEAGSAKTKYSYDAFGAFTAVEHEGHRVEVERDALGREVVRRAGPAASGAATDGWHRTTGLASTAFEVWSAYDRLDRLIEQRIAAPEPGGKAARELHEVARRSWRYDANGRPTSIDDRWGTTNYSYDPLGQLITAKRGSLSEVFEYSVTGSLMNMLTDLEQVGHVAPWKILEGNELVERPRERTRYENDNNGRRTKKIEKGDDGTEATTEYLWDCRDRLREVRLPDGRRALYTYDAFARRVKKEIQPAGWNDTGRLMEAALKLAEPLPASKVTEFLWDGDVLCVELHGDVGARVHVHEPGTFVPLLQAERGEVFTVVNDHLGMPKELVDGKGRVGWAAAHSAWGRVVEVRRDAGTIEGVESPFRLLGQYADEESGLCYTRFRYFDGEAGRWCSPDPLGLAGGLNLLGFDGSPTTDDDPFGLCGTQTKPSGRAGAQQRLREIAADPNTSSADRGWIRQETNAIDRGTRETIRNPPGKQLAHTRGREAAKGYDHVESPSNLQDTDLHRTQHQFDDFGRANKERP